MADPGLGLRFQVEIDGQDLGNWHKCDGLSVKYDIKEYSEGGQNGYTHKLPGRASYETIKLTRPIDGTSIQVAAWLASVQLRLTRHTAHISVLGPDGTTVADWNLSEVFPVRWSGPSLDVAGNQIATETLELAHNGFLGPR